jgi:hypothetical protein
MADGLSVRLEGAAEVEARLLHFGTITTRVPGALARALNRAIVASRTLARRRIAAASGLPQKRIGGRLQVDTASPDRLAARLLATAGRPIPQIAFTGTRGFRSGRGIAGLAYPLSDLQPVSSGAFFAEMRSGHRGIYTRTTRARIPIEEEMGPTIPDIIEARQIFQGLQAEARTVYNRRLAHELDRLVQQLEGP